MRPDPLKPRDLQFIDILGVYAEVLAAQVAAAHLCDTGRGSYGSVSTVRVLESGTRKNTLERPGTVFALKSLSKKSQREMEMVCRIVARPPIAMLTLEPEHVDGCTRL